MRLKDVPWRPYHSPDVERLYAEVRAPDGREIVLWMPGSYGCEVEMRVANQPNQFLTRLEAQCVLIEAVTGSGKPLPNTTTTSSGE